MIQVRKCPRSFKSLLLCFIEFNHINNRSHAIITQNQLKILKQAYNTSSKPTQYVKQLL
jgi:hypothetical protein